MIVDVLSSHVIVSACVELPFASTSSIYIAVTEAYVPLLNAISPAPGSASLVPVSNL